MQNSPNSFKINFLKLCFKDLNNNNTQVHKQYREIASKPTPLPDVIEENETEFPLPNSNQPILVMIAFFRPWNN